MKLKKLYMYNKFYNNTQLKHSTYYIYPSVSFEKTFKTLVFDKIWNIDFLLKDFQVFFIKRANKKNALEYNYMTWIVEKSKIWQELFQRKL